MAFLFPEVQTCAHDLGSLLGESCSGVVMGKGDTEEVPDGDRSRESPFCLFFFFNVFMYFYCAESSLLSRLFFSCRVWASQSGDFSCCGARALGHPGFSSCSPQALEPRPSHCGTEASLFRTVWDPPGSGIKSTSPVMAGGFFTTEPPGKPHFCFILFCFCCHSVHLGADTWSMFVARRSQEVGCQRKQMLRVWDIHSIRGTIIL